MSRMSLDWACLAELYAVSSTMKCILNLRQWWYWVEVLDHFDRCYRWFCYCRRGLEWSYQWFLLVCWAYSPGWEFLCLLCKCNVTRTVFRNLLLTLSVFSPSHIHIVLFHNASYSSHIVLIWHVSLFASVIYMLEGLYMYDWLQFVWHSVSKRCESINTMVSFLWWIVGFYWVVSGGDRLLQDAPRLYW